MYINKLIFLDIDGVLNCHTTKERYGCFLGIDQKLIKIFNEIIKKTQAKVVLSSTWRLDNNWREVMKKNGLQCEFIDRTPHLSDGLYCRGFEINKWLSENKVDKYCIIDDDNDMLPGQKLFHTTFEKGLTEKIADEIIDYLGEE